MDEKKRAFTKSLSTPTNTGTRLIAPMPANAAEDTEGFTLPILKTAAVGLAADAA